MSNTHAPVIGNWYSVQCPVCNSYVTFDCRSRSVYGIQCNACRAIVDLRNPSVALPPGDDGIMADSSITVDYSSLVEDSYGLSASAQLSMITLGIMEEQKKEMPVTISGETSQALLARRMQSTAKKFAFAYPLVRAIEFVIFGTRPIARIGHVQIFRPRLSLFGAKNIPVPKTSVSYASPLLAIIILFGGFTWSVVEIGTTSLFYAYLVESLLVFSLVALMVKLVYMDPGFVRPAYLARDAGRVDVLTLKDIEANKRESLWETIDGQQLERKWCSTCELYRPLRAAHCYHCGMCVMNHDHHCTVIGACVGARNAELFTLFTSVGAIATLWPFLALATELLTGAAFLTTIKFCICVVLTVALGIVAGSVFSLTFSMCYNLMMELTTRERMHNTFENKRNPFDRGILQNLRHHFLEGKSPGIFDEDFVRVCAERM